MILRVKVIKAILTHNTEIGSQMDPFVVLKLGTYEQRGQTFEQAGDMPQFNEHFDFPLTSNNTMLHLIVYDEDTTVDDLVGQTQIDLKPIIVQPLTQKKWYSLKYNGRKPAGKIMLEFQCRMDGVVQAPSKQQVKEMLKPHLHQIGCTQEEVVMQGGKRPLYGQDQEYSNRQIPSYERFPGNDGIQKPHSSNVKGSAVYSFRANGPIQHGHINRVYASTNRLPNQQLNHLSDRQPPNLPTSHQRLPSFQSLQLAPNQLTSTYVTTLSNRSDLSSNNSSRNYMPTYNNIKPSNPTSNHNIYQFYQQQPTYGSSRSIQSHNMQGQNGYGYGERRGGGGVVRYY